MTASPPESRREKEKDYSLPYPHYTRSRIPIIPDPTTPPILRNRARGNRAARASRGPGNSGRLQRRGNRSGARSDRASRSRASTSGVGAARRTAGPGGEGCGRAGLDVPAAKVLVLGCSAAVAPAGEAEHAQMPVYAVLWELVSPRSGEEKAIDGNSGGKKDLLRRCRRRMDQWSW